MISALLSAGYRQVLYVDADAMITNHDFDIESQFSRLATSGKGFLVAQDIVGVNMGVIFAINRPNVQRALDMIWTCDMDIHHSAWEQYATDILMNTYPEFGDVFLVEPEQRLFNSFPAQRKEYIPTDDTVLWQPGDFICHFAGIRAPHLNTLTHEFEARLKPKKGTQ